MVEVTSQYKSLKKSLLFKFMVMVAVSSTEERDGRLYTVTVLLTTKDRVHLAGIMRKIKAMPQATRVRRRKN